MTELIQRAGRAARDPDMTGLFVAMAETWAFELDLGGSHASDPDKPYAGSVKTNSYTCGGPLLSVAMLRSSTEKA